MCKQFQISSAGRAGSAPQNPSLWPASKMNSLEADHDPQEPRGCLRLLAAPKAPFLFSVNGSKEFLCGPAALVMSPYHLPCVILMLREDEEAGLPEILSSSTLFASVERPGCDLGPIKQEQ